MSNENEALLPEGPEFKFIGPTSAQQLERIANSLDQLLALQMAAHGIKTASRLPKPTQRKWDTGIERDAEKPKGFSPGGYTGDAKKPETEPRKWSDGPKPNPIYKDGFVISGEEVRPASPAEKANGQVVLYENRKGFWNLTDEEYDEIEEILFEDLQGSLVGTSWRTRLKTGTKASFDAKRVDKKTIIVVIVGTRTQASK